MLAHCITKVSASIVDSVRWFRIDSRLKWSESIGQLPTRGHSSSSSFSPNLLPLNCTQPLFLSIPGNPFHHSFTSIALLPSFLMVLTSTQVCPISGITFEGFLVGTCDLFLTHGLSGVTLSGTQAIRIRLDSPDGDLSRNAVPGRYSSLRKKEGIESRCT